jgi:hypothetical protein
MFACVICCSKSCCSRKSTGGLSDSLSMKSSIVHRYSMSWQYLSHIWEYNSVPFSVRVRNSRQGVLGMVCVMNTHSCWTVDRRLWLSNDGVVFCSETARNGVSSCSRNGATEWWRGPISGISRPVGAFLLYWTGSSKLNQFEALKRRCSTRGWSLY